MPAYHIPDEVGAIDQSNVPMVRATNGQLLMGTVGPVIDAASVVFPEALAARAKVLVEGTEALSSASRIGRLGLDAAEVGGSRASFYVTSGGVAVPSTGYRAITGDAAVAEVLEGSIAPRPNGTYVTFNDITEMSPSEVEGLLQLPRTPSHVATFDTLPHVESLQIPREYYGSGLFPEPMTTSYPKFGPGGGTQATTGLPIIPLSVKPLPTW